MKLGFIGLGRMGMNMVYNLLDSKHKVVAHNRSPGKIKEVMKKGAIGAFSVEDLVDSLGPRKVVWLMINAGTPVDAMIKRLVPLLKRGDIIVDGGNSFYKDSIRRGKALKKKGIHYLDVGTSGGMGGARNGACMMIGGEKKIFLLLEKFFKDMCVPGGYGYMGNHGAGHFVKMVHNGIEYGMMQAIAEGMQAIDKHSKTFGTDLKTALSVYSNGSIVSSSLVDWTKDGMNRSGYSKISGSVPRGETEGEMRALTRLADMPALRTALRERGRSRKKPSLAGKLTSVMRNEFGGHAVNKK